MIEHRPYQVNDQQSRTRTVDCSVPQGSVLGPQKFNAHIEDLAHLIDDHYLDHHMYADDTQRIEYITASDIPNAIMKLQNCVESIHEGCRRRRLQLNPAKTELIWFGSKASLKKTVHIDLNLYIGFDIIKPVDVVRDLGVFLDSELNKDQHVETHHSRSQKPALASDQATYTVQAVRAYAPAYLADMLTTSADLPGRERLRSANSFRYESGASHTLDRRRGTHFLPIFMN